MSLRVRRFLHSAYPRGNPGRRIPPDGQAMIRIYWQCGAFENLGRHDRRCGPTDSQRSNMALHRRFVMFTHRNICDGTGFRTARAIHSEMRHVFHIANFYCNNLTTNGARQRCAEQ